MVGTVVGAKVGENVGLLVGTVVGREVGAKVGLVVGLLVGAPVGLAVGAFEGEPVGAIVGASVGTVMLLTFIMKALNFWEFSDPRPEAGSQPRVALNPCWQHPATVQLFLPTVMSLVKEPWYL